MSSGNDPAQHQSKETKERVKREGKRETSKRAKLRRPLLPSPSSLQHQASASYPRKRKSSQKERETARSGPKLRIRIYIEEKVMPSEGAKENRSLLRGSGKCASWSNFEQDKGSALLRKAETFMHTALLKKRCGLSQKKTVKRTLDGNQDRSLRLRVDGDATRLTRGG